jgi:hypothetical protein
MGLLAQMEKQGKVIPLPPTDFFHAYPRKSVMLFYNIDIGFLIF